MKKTKFLRYTTLALIVVMVSASLGAISAFANTQTETHAFNQQGNGPQKAFLGIQISDQDGQVVIVTVMPNSPAAEAGLLEDDVIVSFAGETIETASQLVDLVTDHAPEDTVSLSIQRGDETLDIEVTLGSQRPNVITERVPSVMPMNPRGNAGNRPNRNGDFQLGVSFRTLTPEIAEQEGIEIVEGALITEIIEDSPASDAGLAVGDVITAVDGDIVDQERTLSDRLFAYETEDRVILTIQRDGEELEVGATLAAEHPAKRNNNGFGIFMPNGLDIRHMPGGRIQIGGMPSLDDLPFDLPNIDLPDLSDLPDFSNINISISTEAPTEIPEGHSAYVCSHGDTQLYVVIPNEVPNLDGLGQCELYEPTE